MLIVKTPLSWEMSVPKTSWMWNLNLMKQVLFEKSEFGSDSALEAFVYGSVIYCLHWNSQNISYKKQAKVRSWPSLGWVVGAKVVCSQERFCFKIILLDGY